MRKSPRVHENEGQASVRVFESVGRRDVAAKLRVHVRGDLKRHGHEDALVCICMMCARQENTHSFRLRMLGTQAHAHRHTHIYKGSHQARLFV
jgi:hypothetical protein